ncbi:MAG: MarR family transcriptional regulator [Pseudomonadota bacterium]
MNAKARPDKTIPEAGLASDPALFKLLTEIDMIAHLASNEFARLLPPPLTEAQFGVLNRLMRLDCKETISELADAFQVAQPTMSSTVKKLVQHGFVEIAANEKDARIKHVGVTGAGKAIRNETIKIITPHLNELQTEGPAEDWNAILPALTALRDFLDQRRLRQMQRLAS